MRSSQFLQLLLWAAGPPCRRSRLLVGEPAAVAEGAVPGLPLPAYALPAAALAAATVTAVVGASPAPAYACADSNLS